MRNPDSCSYKLYAVQLPITDHARAIVGSVLLASILFGCQAEVEPPKAAVKVRTYDELIVDSSCLSCHAQNNRMGAPTWKKVAKRYKKEKVEIAVPKLMDKIAHGGAGVWGKMNMPPNTDLSADELKLLAEVILATGKPAKVVKAEPKSELVYVEPAKKKLPTIPVGSLFMQQYYWIVSK